jgi:hypothetical protein
VRQANPFDTGDADLLSLDERGYVRELPVLNEAGEPLAAAALLCRVEGGRYPAGRYVCLYDGDGVVEFGFDAREVSRAPGRIELDVTPSNAGILLRIVRSNPEDHIRNIRVYMPGFEEAGEAARRAGRTVFHPLFLERLRPFSTLRFMDWQRTNDSVIETPGDLASFEDRTWATERGAPLSVITDLCNALGADAWVCVPHGATDETMGVIARALRAGLEEDLRVYVEYSNEVWNARFEQYHWVSESIQESLIHPSKYAHHCRRAFEAFMEAFGDRPDSIVRVVAGQHYNPWVLRRSMEALEGEFDAASTAAYFGLPVGGGVEVPDDATAESLLPLIRRAAREGVRRLEENKAWADEHGVRFIAYEGGQHLSPPNPGTETPWDEALRALQRGEIMTEAYQATMRAFASLGGDLFVAFNYCQTWDERFGYWGALEHQDEDLDEAVKYRALLQAAQVGPPVDRSSARQNDAEGGG